MKRGLRCWSSRFRMRGKSASHDSIEQERQGRETDISSLCLITRRGSGRHLPLWRSVSSCERPMVSPQKVSRLGHDDVFPW
jgi:hypothetical protein